MSKLIDKGRFIYAVNKQIGNYKRTNWFESTDCAFCKEYLNACIRCPNAKPDGCGATAFTCLNRSSYPKNRKYRKAPYLSRRRKIRILVLEKGRDKIIGYLEENVSITRVRQAQDEAEEEVYKDLRSNKPIQYYEKNIL